jgi:hypothetical protein
MEADFTQCVIVFYLTTDTSMDVELDTGAITRRTDNLRFLARPDARGEGLQRFEAECFIELDSGVIYGRDG